MQALSACTKKIYGPKSLQGYVLGHWRAQTKGIYALDHVASSENLSSVCLCHIGFYPFVVQKSYVGITFDLFEGILSGETGSNTVKGKKCLFVGLPSQCTLFLVPQL